VHSRRRAHVITVAIAIIAVGVTAATGAWVASGNTTAVTSERLPTVSATATVVRGTISEVTRVAGTLQFDRQRVVGSGLAGVLTGMPAVGDLAGLGATLYTVDTRPVSLLHGALPAWRNFGSGMKDGPDVLQLESNLKAMGFFSGTPDVKFTWATRTAISSWQRALGQDRTGVIERGTVLFVDGDVRISDVRAVRISDVRATVGTELGVGSEVLSISSRYKVVRADLKLDDQRLAVIGAKVTVSLPDGATSSGTVSVVGVPTDRDQGTGSVTSVIPVTIAIADQTVTTSFQKASVTLGFTSEQRDDALTVPVDALLALDDTTFGVEVVSKNGATKRMAVKTGLFAAGRVEVSGTGIAEGVSVVVPKR